MYCVVIFEKDLQRDVHHEFTGVVLQKWMISDKLTMYPAETKHVAKALRQQLDAGTSSIIWESWKCRIVKNSITGG